MTGIRTAKQKAMENTVWRIGMSQKRQRPSIPEEPKKQRNLPVQKKPHMDTTTKGVTCLAIPQASARKRREFHIDEGSMNIVKHGPPPKKADEPEEISDYQPSRDSEADAGEIDDDSEEPESVVKFLSVEVRQTAEPFPFSSAQPRAPLASRAKSQSTHDQTRAKTQFNACGPIKTPTWAYDSNDGVIASDDWEGLEAVSDNHNDPESPKNNFLVVDNNDNDNDDNDSGHREEPILVWSANAGKLKLMDQTSDTRCVVQRAILEAKVHMTFVSGYPELTEKNRFTRDMLLTAAHTCGVVPIQHCLKTDDSYASASALATLVEAQVPLFHTELKDDTCTQVTAYYRLGPDCIDASKALLASHVYHFGQHFNCRTRSPSPGENVPIQQATKPYSADILPYLMKGCYFNGPKLVGMKFTDRFKEITGNKAQWPQVTIPMVALTSTSVYATLLWKASKSPSKFNFTGNQFSEVYFFHVNFLTGMKETVPGKFHRLMADIFEALQ
ncbi:hypothetical protein DFH29DRAFT_1002419 [Suillus ampliporus]|nr:hypothetical protein DFH29DRAFT_1002419 [Suillus ampliporus]